MFLASSSVSNEMIVQIEAKINEPTQFVASSLCSTAYVQICNTL